MTNLFESKMNNPGVGESDDVFDRDSVKKRRDKIYDIVLCFEREHPFDNRSIWRLLNRLQNQVSEKDLVDAGFGWKDYDLLNTSQDMKDLLPDNVYFDRLTCARYISNLSGCIVTSLKDLEKFLQSSDTDEDTRKIAKKLYLEFNSFLLNVPTLRDKVIIDLMADRFSNVFKSHEPAEAVKVYFENLKNDELYCSGSYKDALLMRLYADCVDRVINARNDNAQMSKIYRSIQEASGMGDGALEEIITALAENIDWEGLSHRSLSSLSCLHSLHEISRKDPKEFLALIKKQDVKQKVVSVLQEEYAYLLEYGNFSEASFSHMTAEFFAASPFYSEIIDFDEGKLVDLAIHGMRYRLYQSEYPANKKPPLTLEIVLRSLPRSLGDKNRMKIDTAFKQSSANQDLARLNRDVVIDAEEQGIDREGIMKVLDALKTYQSECEEEYVGLFGCVVREEDQQGQQAYEDKKERFRQAGIHNERELILETKACGNIRTFLFSKHKDSFQENDPF